MQIQRLDSSRRYFDEITEKSYRQFMRGEVNFLVIYSMSMGLYHICEWVYLHDLSKLQAKYGNQVNSPAAFWHQVVEHKVPGAGFIRDLNNASKHAKLRFDPTNPKKGDPSTGMHHAANTFISTTGWGQGGFGTSLYGGGAQVKMDEGNREVMLEPIATAVFLFWECLMDEFHPK